MVAWDVARADVVEAEVDTAARIGETRAMVVHMVAMDKVTVAMMATVVATTTTEVAMVDMEATTIQIMATMVNTPTGIS